MKFQYHLIICFFISVASSFGQNIDLRIERLSIKDGLVIGKIYANNKYLGPSYENEVLRIEEGTYKGFLRYHSNSSFVSSSLGKLATEGDFLLEVGSVTNRRDLLFHTGNKPYHARGCVLLGSPTVSAGEVFLPMDHPLRQIRALFYGTDNPISSPNKNVSITLDETKLKTKNDSVNSSLLILIDVSGSMSGVKLVEAKKSANEAVKKALKNKNTEVAILAFADKCSNPIHTAIGFSTNEKFLLETIKRLKTEGGTPLAAAIEKANAYMTLNKSFNSITQMIILLGDGEDDCGNLSSVMSNLSKQEIVFRHETIGLGLDDNSNAQKQLQSIATITKGNYHNAASSTDLAEKFGEAIENMKMLEMMGKLSNPQKSNDNNQKTKKSEINWDILKQ